MEANTMNPDQRLTNIRSPEANTMNADQSDEYKITLDRMF